MYVTVMEADNLFLVSSNLLWLFHSLAGHVQRSTAVLHCEKRERERERRARSLTAGCSFHATF